MTTDLASYGWTDELQATWNVAEFTDTYIPARVVADYGRKYTIATPEHTAARLAGSLVHSLSTVAMPKVGDWVAVERSGDDYIVQAILPRTTEIVRGHVSRRQSKQVVAANVDIAFVMQSLGADFSPERLERYIFQLQQQHITPIVLLNKADLCEDIATKQAQVLSLDVTSITMSALTDENVTAVLAHIPIGKTAVIMGSSGVGKSTLTNRILGRNVQATAAVRESDDKGRHTTIHRELFVVPNAGMIIDTPGIRELQLWGSIDDLHASFPEIATALRSCKYPRCSHSHESGCAIRDGLADGGISQRRYDAYVNFKKELVALQDYSGKIDERRTAQSKASAKRRKARQLRDEYDISDTNW